MLDELLVSLVEQFEVRSGFDIPGGAGLVANIIESLVIVLVVIGMRRLVMRLAARQTENPASLYTWRKATDYVAPAIIIYFFWRIWIPNTSSRDFATYFGLLSAGLAIALQDLIVNFIGWIFLLVRRPFEVGNRIEIGEHAGDVVDIHFFQFSLLEIGGWVDAEQSTGRILHIPNRLVFSQGVANYSKGIAMIWNEIPVLVSFESDWKKAKKLMLEIASHHVAEIDTQVRTQMKRAARDYGISYQNLKPTVYTKVEPSGVMLTLRYLCRPRGRRDSEQIIWEEILEAVAGEKDIDFAYPTQRIFYHPTEGKTLDLEPHVQVDQEVRRQLDL